MSKQINIMRRLQAVQAAADPSFDERETAKLMNSSPRSLQRHRQHGTGPEYFHPTPRRVAYRLSAITRWINERELGGEHAAQ